MKKTRFSEQQIAFVLRQAEEGTPVAAWGDRIKELLPYQLNMELIKAVGKGYRLIMDDFGNIVLILLSHKVAVCSGSAS